MEKDKRILIVDDEEEICKVLARLVEREGLSPLLAYDGETALKTIQAENPDVLVLDFMMPEMNGLEVMRRAKALDDDLPVILITGFAGVRGAVDAMKAGAHDYIEKPFDQLEVVRVILRALRERDLKRKLKDLSNQKMHQDPLGKSMGPSEAVARLIMQVNRVAKSDFSVVIQGETGTGKDVVARALHRASHRSRFPFVPVDCGAIPEALFESELFGHEQGAFTGASVQQSGKFEAARGGTLFLDEIANMPIGSQSKILRAIQEKSIFRVGGTKSIQVDVRLMTASNEDIQELTKSGSFRQDLYFRLNEFTIRVPPLRERQEDIPYLAKRFLEIANVELQKNVRGFSKISTEKLLDYEWPGNVRQLRSTIRRAVLLADDIIHRKHLDIKSFSPTQWKPSSGNSGESIIWESQPLKEIVRRSTIQVEREVLIQALRKVGGNKAKAARLLQIDYKTIHSKVKEYGIGRIGKENLGKE